MNEIIAACLAKTPFVPHSALTNGHAQTIVGSLIRRRFSLVPNHSEPRIFNTTPGVRVLGYCSWQPERASKSTVVIVHGMEGSTESRYMLGTAEKAFGAGFNAIRINLRNCGGTAHLAPTLYHAGLTDDLRQVIAELIGQDGLSDIYIAGFSLGGNVALKLAGEYGETAPAELKGVTAVSPSLDLASCADAIELRKNWVYHLRFIMSLRASMRQKARLFPDRFNTSELGHIWTIRKFDDTYTAPLMGFQDVNDYYARASALPLIKRIRTRTLIIQAKDDPFIPYGPFEGPEIADNPNVILLGTEHGGHVGFISARAEGEERFWSEKMIVEFVRCVNSSQQAQCDRRSSSQGAPGGRCSTVIDGAREGIE